MSALTAHSASVVKGISWGDDLLMLDFSASVDAPVSLTQIVLHGRRLTLHVMPLIEILANDSGHNPASGRLAHTAIGQEMRYLNHEIAVQNGLSTLTIHQTAGHLKATITLERRAGSVIRSTVTVLNTSEDKTSVLRAVPSWTAGLPSGDDISFEAWTLTHGRNDWLGEGRWSTRALRGLGLRPLDSALTGHNPRGSLHASSAGTWSTGESLPVAIVANAEAGFAAGWQVEHNGAWRWEIGEDISGAYVSLSGPTDSDSGWTLPLQPGGRFQTVPVSIAFGHGQQAVLESLTWYRRSARREHVDNTALPVVFNDYMNTLNGDPTTEKLLPLIEAAANVGAEVFCIDAGWYDDTGNWWNSVGEWTASQTRFPGGLAVVIDAIQERGMIPGLWLEPEVVGVESPVADMLPFDAFFQRHGQRIVEHGRYHLDLRHSAAKAHIDRVVDRLISEWGIGFLKLDYNINPGPGTDVDGVSPGHGLLEHNRAHLAWLDGVLSRHPHLIIENCASGGMRADFALLSRVAMQSTSDQQNYLLYPPIAATAPMMMPPEQAASWAYPQPDMGDEAIVFCLVTGLLGRFYVSGHLAEMSQSQRDQVAEAVVVAKRLRPSLTKSTPVWPLGLPDWNDDWVALGLCDESETVLSVWRRNGARQVSMHLPQYIDKDIKIDQIFPTGLLGWRTKWSAGLGVLTVTSESDVASARTFRLRPKGLPR